MKPAKLFVGIASLVAGISFWPLVYLAGPIGTLPSIVLIGTGVIIIANYYREKRKNSR